MKTKTLFTYTLALCMALCLALFLLPAAAQAADEADYTWYGEGSATEYTLNDAADLLGFANIVSGRESKAADDFKNKTVTLGDDIELPDNWLPIGGAIVTSEVSGGTYGKIDLSSSEPFCGTFDGNEHRLTNLALSNDDVVGSSPIVGALFSTLEGAVIRDLIIEDVSLTDSSNTLYMTAVAGQASDTLFYNVDISGSIECFRPSGIVTAAQDCSFDGCDVTVDMNAAVGTNKGIVIGGLAQQIVGVGEKTVFYNCTYTGTITVDGSNASYLWAGGMFGGTSYSKPTFYFPVILDNCRADITWDVSNRPSVYVYSEGRSADTTSQSTKSNFFEGLLGRTHIDLAVTVIEMDGDVWISVGGRAEQGEQAFAKPVASITKSGKNAYYPTLAEAVAAAKANDTIKLLKDVTFTETLEIKDGKDFTLNLNNHDITTSHTDDYTVFPLLKIQNAKVNVTGVGTIAPGGTYFKHNSQGIQLLGSEQENAANYTVLTVGKDVKIGGYAHAVQIQQTKNKAYGVVVNIYGTLDATYDTTGKTYLDNYGTVGITTNGKINATTGNVPKINVFEGAKVNSIYAAGYAEWNISGGTITGDDSGIGIKAGKLKITGGTVSCTGRDTAPTSGYSNGIEASGAAIQIESNSDYAGKIEIDIANATITSANGYSIYEYLGKGTATAVERINITSGKFKGGILISEQLGTKKVITITGGYFTTNPSAYVPSTHQAGTSDLTGYSYMVQKFVPVVVDIPEEIKPVPPVVPEPVVEDLPEGHDTDLADNAATAAKETTIAPDSADDLSGLAVSDVITTPADPAQPADTKIKISEGEHKLIAEVLTEAVDKVKNLPGINNTSLNATDLTIVVQPSLEIKVTGATAADSGTGAAATLTLDITPMSQILVTTKAVAETENIVGNASGATNANAVKVGEPQPIKADIWPPITITIPLPAGFVNSTGDSLLIKHDKGGGEVYYYTATLRVDNTKNPAQYYATFTVTKGFSDFTLMATTTPTLAVTYYDTDGTTLIGADTYVEGDAQVNEELLNPNKSGYTFDGWSFTDANDAPIAGVNGTYKELTAGLWNVLMPATSSGNRTVNAVAQFTRISTGGGGGGGGAPTYTITAAAADNGSISLSKSSAASGTAITVTLKPDAGYEAGTVAVKDAKDNAVSVTKNDDGAYTFTMPAANVTVTATFVAATETPADGWVNPFTDVNTGDWFYGAVQYVNENGLMQGTDATTFEPYTTMSRAMLVTVL
ncbi:MAG: S-layer homology domain-containing protein, partial [Syntrophomonadaceae bacterium]|nr:S-layer homology domain-containing protein [Syntrophomonadaceae bacterium]